MTLKEATQASNALLQQLKNAGYRSYIIKLKNNKYYMDTLVSGEKVSMVVDTGAHACLLNAKIARKLKLGLKNHSSPVLFTYDKNKKQAFQTSASFQIGDFKIANFPFLVLEESRLDGLIGMNLLFPHKAVLDARAGVLHLQPAAGKGASLKGRLTERGYTAIPLHVHNLRPFVNVTVGGVEGFALVDTGAAFSVFDIGFLAELEKSRGQKIGELADLGNNRRGFFVATFDPITIGPYQCDPKKVGTTDLSHIAKRAPVRMAMLLGADLLHENHAIVDLAGGMLYLKR